MVLMPNLNDYSINALIALGNRTSDVFTRNQIKLSIVSKIIELRKPMFFLLNKFLSSDKILKEAYADAIMIYMKGNEYYINDGVIDEVLRYASLDALMYYGADSNSLEFSMKCKEEFDNRAKFIEDKVELVRKRNMDENSELKVIYKKKKGDYNDKY